MWVDDGQPLALCGLSGIAVGWLELGHPYRTAAVPPIVVDRLAEVLSHLAWGPSCLGYHHCDLGFCRARLEMRSALERISTSFFLETFHSEKLKRQTTASLQSDATIRRTLSRHHRRHGSAGSISGPPMPSVMKKPRTASILGVTQAIGVAAGAAMRAIRSVTDAVDPHPYREHWGTARIDVGCSNLFIPGSTQIYIAPSMVLHYISRHRYRPPNVFCDALLRCPPIGTRMYFEALRPGVPALPTNEFGTWVDQQLSLVRNVSESSRQ